MKPKSRVRTSVVIVQAGKILTFFSIDPNDGREFHFLPGGAIETHETAPEAAVRETMEETGYNISVEAESGIDREYLFHWNGEDYDCLTLFYRGYLTPVLQSPKPVKDADYNKEVRWISVHDIEKIFSYNQEIKSAVKELVCLPHI